MYRFLKLLLFFVVFFIFSSVPKIAYAQDFSEEILEGKVISITENEIEEIINIDVYKGSLKGSVIEVSNQKINFAKSPEYSVGDKLSILYTQNQLTGEPIFYITDFVRREGLFFLVAVFVFAAVLIGGKWGALSLVGMGFSFLVIFQFILPQIVMGRNAIFVAILGTSIIIPVNFILSHGLKRKTLIASLSTVITLFITGLLAVIAVQITHLSGFGSEEASFLLTQLGPSINLKGLLLAGIIISVVGVLDDITISQASIVSELNSANKKFSKSELFIKAMNVGRDHIASLINTLVLVYAGASLPLLLLFTNSEVTYAEVINMELIAEEIVRTLVGSLGLILAVPITTAMAVSFYKKDA